MKRLIPIIMTACLLLTAGCNTVYKAVVTICDVEDAAMREWADAHNRGITSIDLDKKVDAAHQKFNQAKMTSRAALEAYKATGNQDDYVKAIATVRAAANEVINLITPVISAGRSTELNKMLKSSNTIGGN